MVALVPKMKRKMIIVMQKILTTSMLTVTWLNITQLWTT
jgi:hypothetical protein